MPTSGFIATSKIVERPLIRREMLDFLMNVLLDPEISNSGYITG